MQSGDLFIERRKFQRKDKQCSVKFRLISEEEGQEIKRSVIKSDGQSEDISIGGMRMTGNLKAKSGDILRIELLLDSQKEPVTTFAEVKWIKGSNQKSEIGIEFLILKDRDRELIENMLQE
jgi:c-di-GMP-binding flagellar brake protein YcgR